MEAFAIPTPTLYLDGLILASTVYPSGLSASFLALRRVPQQQVSTPLLAFLTLPFAAVAAGVWALRPQLLEIRGAPSSLLLLAAAAAPLAVGVELLVHGAAALKTGGRRPRGITLDRFWGGRLSFADTLLLAAVVVGEELVYRQLWIALLIGSFGLPPLAALALSSLLYGLNHLAFGLLNALSKSLVGLIFGGLFLAGGSLWPPLAAHALFNLLIFLLAGRERD